MPEPAAAIARFFIEKASQEGVEMTPMKVIKLVYISHGWHLHLTGDRLINEDVEAWKYGPVIRPLYNRFKGFADNSIPQSAVAREPALSAPDRLSGFLNSVWGIYKNFTGTQLSTMTHAPGTPWSQTYDPRCLDETIPDSLIKEHYDKLAAQRTANA